MADLDGGAVATEAPSAPAAEPVGDYDQVDPGTTAFDSVQLASAAESAKTSAPAPEATPADSAGAAQAAGSPTPAASTAPASSGDAAASTGQPTDAASPASAPAPTSNNQAAAAVAPQPQLTQDQIQRAQQLGWNPEVLSGYQNPEVELLRAEKLALNAMLAGQRQALAAIPQGQPQQAAAQQAQQTQQVAPAPLVPPPPFDENATRQFWTDQGFDPLVVNQQVEVARANHAHATQIHQMAAQNQQMSQQLQHVTRFLGEQQAQRHAEQVQHQNELINRDFESFRSTLPAEVAKSIDPATQQQIFKMAEVIVRGHLQSQTPPQMMPDNKALFTQATVAVLGFEKMSAIARDQVRQEVKQHQDVRIARPTSGGKPHQSPDDAASSYAEQWWATHVGATGNASSAPEV